MVEYQREELLIRTFRAQTQEEIDKLVNDFKDKNVVRFTHTHIETIEASGELKTFYTYVCFYLPKDKTAPMPVKEQPREEFKDCPKCGVRIPLSYRLHLKCGWRADAKG